MAENLRQKGCQTAAARKRVKIALASALGAVAIFAVSASTPARATDIDDYRWDHDQANCRVVETRTTNRWGEDVTIRRRVCG